jgi:glutamine synthetase, type I
MSKDNVIKLIKEHEVKYVDLRFCDTRGKEQHVTIPVTSADDDFFENGKMFDGSSIAGWKGIHESDMVLMPDTVTAVMDPFFDEATLNIRCDVLEPTTMKGYGRDPRSLGKNAEAYLKSTGIADAAYFGPEPEFFIFDEVRWDDSINTAFYEIDSEEGSWNTGMAGDEPNTGHRPGVKGGYFPVPPVDSQQNIRSAMCSTLSDMGVIVEVHHHEVATAGQNEIGTKFNTLVRKADELLILKYVLQNVAHAYGKTVTFMPKPLVGDNGNGMHVHQSLAKGGKNIFAGNMYGGLSQEALWYIGGIFKHSHAINAFTNSGTNSYKRLVPGFEAPTLLAYSARNRSASIRVPWVSSPKARRIEVRFPDSNGNPYFMFAAMMMAGLDGILNKIDPGAPSEKDLYDLEPEEEKLIPTVCHSLDMALNALDKDRAFLTAGNVFNDDLIDAYIGLKMQELTRFRMTTHPIEFDMYYSL